MATDREAEDAERGDRREDGDEADDEAETEPLAGVPSDGLHVIDDLGIRRGLDISSTIAYFVHPKRSC